MKKCLYTAAFAACAAIASGEFVQAHEEYGRNRPSPPTPLSHSPAHLPGGGGESGRSGLSSPSPGEGGGGAGEGDRGGEGSAGEGGA